MLTPLILGLLTALATPPAATCYGRPGEGRLEGGVALPLHGKNFQAYSRMATGLDRFYVHPIVHAILLESFATLSSNRPALRFMIGETGHAKGGPFRPHRTHQSGTSVDLFVPMKDAQGAAAHLPAWPTNKFGYALDLDKAGRLGDLQLDFDALAVLLSTIEAVARRHEAPLKQVILAPEFRPLLFKADPRLRALPFLKGKAWVRHDEHIHLDFGVRCAPL